MITLLETTLLPALLAPVVSFMLPTERDDRLVVNLLLKAPLVALT
jgi:hypothetical protein